MNNKVRIIVAALSASALFYTGLVSHEGYRAKPYPDSGGVVTIGIGSTVYPDGRKVTMNDAPITRKQAIELAKSHVSKDEVKFRSSIPNVALHQEEYDVFLDFVYNYGSRAWDNSSMRRNLLKGDYLAACKSLLKYRFVKVRRNGKVVVNMDCSLPQYARKCGGVWKRTKWRYQTCMGVQ